MNIENLKWITNQILSYVQENKDESINVPGDLLGYPVPNTVIGHAVCTRNDPNNTEAFSPSKYPKPENLTIIFVQQWISLKEKRYLYFKFELQFHKNSFYRAIPLTVRWSPLDKAYWFRSRGRRAILKHCLYTKHGKIYFPKDKRKNPRKNYRIYYSNDPDDIIEEFRNLIIVNLSNKAPNQQTVHEVALQIGIYLYHEGIRTRNLYKLFLQVTNYSVLKKNIFQRLIKRFSVPNQSASFRGYIRQIYRPHSNTRNIGTKEDYIGYITSEKDVMNIKVSNRDIYGVNPQTVHILMYRGKLTIPKDASGKYDWEKGKEDIENYKKWVYDKKSLRKFANTISAKRGIDFKSVQRAIQRLKKTEPNLSLEEIKEGLKKKFRI